MAPKVSSDECNIQFSGDGPEKSKGGTGEVNLVEDCTREKKFILTPDGKCVRFCKCFVGEEEELLQLAASCGCSTCRSSSCTFTCAHRILSLFYDIYDQTGKHPPQGNQRNVDVCDPDKHIVGWLHSWMACTDLFNGGKTWRRIANRTREEKIILTPDGKCVRFCKCFVGEEEELLQLAATCRCISGTRCGRVTTCSHYLLLVMITQQKPACNLHMPAFVSMGLTITAVE